jgi:hypothetical protein
MIDVFFEAIMIQTLSKKIMGVSAPAVATA